MLATTFRPGFRPFRAPRDRCHTMPAPLPRGPGSEDRPAMPFALSPDRERKLQEMVGRYPTKMALTLPLLHLCQEQEGYVGDDVILFVSQRLDLPPSHVKGVVTFYTLY